MVDLNSSTVRQLAAFPGIDNPLAEAIIRYRCSQGGFHGVNELWKVNGMTRSKFQILARNFQLKSEKTAVRDSPESKSPPDKSLVDFVCKGESLAERKRKGEDKKRVGLSSSTMHDMIQQNIEYFLPPQRSFRITSEQTPSPPRSSVKKSSNSTICADKRKSAPSTGRNGPRANAGNRAKRERERSAPQRMMVNTSRVEEGTIHKSTEQQNSAPNGCTAPTASQQRCSALADHPEARGAQNDCFINPHEPEKGTIQTVADENGLDCQNKGGINSTGFILQPSASGNNINFSCKIDRRLLNNLNEPLALNFDEMNKSGKPRGQLDRERINEYVAALDGLAVCTPDCALHQAVQSEPSSETPDMQRDQICSPLTIENLLIFDRQTRLCSDERKAKIDQWALDVNEARFMEKTSRIRGYKQMAKPIHIKTQDSSQSSQPLAEDQCDSQVAHPVISVQVKQRNKELTARPPARRKSSSAPEQISLVLLRESRNSRNSSPVTKCSGQMQQKGTKLCITPTKPVLKSNSSPDTNRPAKPTTCAKKSRVKQTRNNVSTAQKTNQTTKAIRQFHIDIPKNVLLTGKNNALTAGKNHFRSRNQAHGDLRVVTGGGGGTCKVGGSVQPSAGCKAPAPSYRYPSKNESAKSALTESQKQERLARSRQRSLIGHILDENRGMLLQKHSPKGPQLTVV